METAEAKHLAFTQGFYERYPRYDHGTLRSAYGDAAHMCDAIAADIEREHTVCGRVTKEGKALADAVRRAGNVIWAMRDSVFKAN